MTIDEFIQVGRLQSKMQVYKNRKRRAIQASADMFSQTQNPYLALSGGKDSVAMAFVVEEAARMLGRDYKLWTHLSDASFPGTRETCEKVAHQLGREIDFFESEISAFEAIKEPQKAAFGKTGYFFTSVKDYAKDHDGCFVGVRAAESSRRMRSAKIHGQIFYSKSMGDVTICHPLLWYHIEDVAAALYEYDAPIHPIYCKTPINMGADTNGERFIRLAYLTSRDLLNKGTALFIRVNYPDEFAKLAEVWPEIRRYV